MPGKIENPAWLNLLSLKKATLLFRILPKKKPSSFLVAKSGILVCLNHSFFSPYIYVHSRISLSKTKLKIPAFESLYLVDLEQLISLFLPFHRIKR
jgi:hypothetical protein